MLKAACVLASAIAVFAQANPIFLRAYAGVDLRDNVEGTVVSRVHPGPFMPTDAEHALLRRNDLILSANEQQFNASQFEGMLSRHKPGDELTLVIRRSANADALAALPVGDTRGEELHITVKLECADDYVGTLGRADEYVDAPRRPNESPEASQAEPSELERRVENIAKRANEWGTSHEPSKLQRLSRLLGPLRSRDMFVLPAVFDALDRPLSIDAVEASVSRAVHELATKPDQEHIRAFVASLLISPGKLLPREAPTALAAEQLARRLRDSVTIENPDAKALIATINAAPTGVREFVLSDKHWRSVEEWTERLRLGAATTPRTDFPQDLRDSFTGDILYFERLEDGRYAVAGADGANSYNMDVIEIVYDIGGNDTYYFGATHPTGEQDKPCNHIIVDLSGNDEYISESDFHGPGVAINGFSFIDDRSGDDVYRSTSQFGIAAGLFGVGVILDRAGNDRYENCGPNSGWAIGAAIYGAGLLIDLAGDDTYSAEKLSEGATGPFAIGAIIDAAGNDTYTANGPSFPSAYNTPNTYLSMSQGFSMGIRGYASGGIGAIYDFQGNDHYIAGEFSQGCGYSYALGILHDSDGDDLYDGNRYSQAAAAHQAAGVLIDDSGNDHYTAKTAACQSGAWDQSITLLIDRAGDDTYTADDLCQGAAAQQAISLFFDLGGNDRYQAAGGVDPTPGLGASVQGRSGTNEYHYDAHRMFSFSLFSDVGGTSDFFSTGRTGFLRTGAIDEKDPAKSRAHGIFSKE
ncbi:MAG: hypothetical protein ACREJD_07790 [Phycisphaerales bacterium]